MIGSTEILDNNKKDEEFTVSNERLDSTLLKSSKCLESGMYANDIVIQLF